MRGCDLRETWFVLKRASNVDDVHYYIRCLDGWRTNLILREKTVLILQTGRTGEE